MVQAGQEVFVSFAGGPAVRVLHGAKVTERADELITVEYLEPEGVPGEPDGPLTVFFEGPKEFMQQPGELAGGDEGLVGGATAAIRLFGEPVSAESRRCYRVGTVLADYRADLGALGVCKLVDVSAVGVGFLSDRRLKPGRRVEIKFNLGRATSHGMGFIQSVKEVRRGYRYGLLCAEDKGHGGLARGLQQLTMDAQRTQLRRLSGAA